MPTYRYRRRRTRRHRDQGHGWRRRARTRCATSCLLRNLEVEDRQAEEEASTSSSSRRSASRAQEIMHFSRQMAAFVRTGIPITDALEVVEEGSGNKRFRRSSPTIARADQQRRAVLGGARRARRRCSRRTTSASCGRPSSPASSTSSLEQLSAYIERDLELAQQDQVGDGLPDGRSSCMSIVTVVILAGLRHAEVHRVLQGPRRRSCRCRRGCCIDVVGRRRRQLWFVWRRR